MNSRSEVECSTTELYPLASLVTRLLYVTRILDLLNLLACENARGRGYSPLIIIIIIIIIITNLQWHFHEVALHPLFPDRIGI